MKKSEIMRLQRRRRKNYQESEKEVRLRGGKYDNMGEVHSEVRI